MAWEMTPNAPSPPARARWRGAPPLFARARPTVSIFTHHSLPQPPPPTNPLTPTPPARHRSVPPRNASPPAPLRLFSRPVSCSTGSARGDTRDIALWLHFQAAVMERVGHGVARAGVDTYV